MTTDKPLSRLLVVDTIPAAGLEVTVEADAAERAALARDFGLPGIASLKGVYKVTRRGSTVTLAGTVHADVTQACVVTLEPFEAKVAEPVDLRFTDDPAKLDPPHEGGEHEAAVDAPDPIVNGRIDLGAVTAEFLALGLDPYPRKPGVSFDFPADEGEPSPFAKLAALKKPPES